MKNWTLQVFDNQSIAIFGAITVDELDDVLTAFCDNDWVYDEYLAEQLEADLAFSHPKNLMVTHA